MFKRHTKPTDLTEPSLPTLLGHGNLILSQDINEIKHVLGNIIKNQERMARSTNTRFVSLDEKLYQLGERINVTRVPNANELYGKMDIVSEYPPEITSVTPGKNVEPFNHEKDGL